MPTVRSAVERTPVTAALATGPAFPGAPDARSLFATLWERLLAAAGEHAEGERKAATG
ncbi:hypothetical protein ACIBG6_33275 [Streptomyces sp. NPDC050842]|uniref:hypothetical protein n=1 Tax=Streptomyces sp. NPDC050842 TaxID=3365636 RepID=UPI0037BAE17A